MIDVLLVICWARNLVIFCIFSYQHNFHWH